MLTLENVRQIRDEKFLAKIAKASGNLKNIKSQISEQATSQIESNEILKEIIEESILNPSKYMIARIAIEKINNEEVCKYVIEKEDRRDLEYSIKYLLRYEDLCIVAAKKIRNQETLKHIALTDSNFKVRNIAISSLNDIETLKYIISNKSEADLIKKAAKIRLIAIRCSKKDQSEIIDTYETAIDVDIQIAIIRYITDQNFLRKIATTEEHWNLRCEAVAKIFDNQLLFDIVNKDKVPKVKERACMNISSYQYLEQIISGAANDESITDVAIKRLNSLSGRG